VRAELHALEQVALTPTLEQSASTWQGIAHTEPMEWHMPSCPTLEKLTHRKLSAQLLLSRFEVGGNAAS
jgi:hypothetical protein